MAERYRNIGPPPWGIDFGWKWRCKHGGSHDNQRDAEMCETGQLPVGWGCEQSRARADGGPR